MRTSTFTQNLLGMQSELYRFAMKLTADNEEANDLLQETSLKALDNEEKYTPDTNFKGWMYTIMRNILTHRLGLYGDEFKTCRLHLMTPLKKAAGMVHRVA